MEKPCPPRCPLQKHYTELKKLEEHFNLKKTLHFPVTFAPNIGPDPFHPCIIGLSTATEASFEARAKTPSSHYLF